MNQNFKALLLAAFTFMAIACAFLPFAASQGTASIVIAGSADPTIVAITGTDFDPNETVTITMYQLGGLTPLQTFSSVTDGQGNFATTLTLPPVLESGIYTFSASTTNANAYTGHVILNPNDQQSPTPGPTTKALNATPNNSHIFNVTGVGFAASREVTLVLKNSQGAMVYRFPNDLETDAQGRFSAIRIVPTSMNGTFTLEASALGQAGSATTQVLIPNLRGEAGPSGQPGPSGEPGPTGPAGTEGAAGATYQGEQTIAYAALALSAVALALSAFSLLKRHK